MPRPTCLSRLARLVVALLLPAALSLPAQAQNADAPSLRERIQARIAQRKEAPAAEPAAITRPGDYSFSFEHGGATRQYRVHVPASYRDDTPRPLLLVFHGGGGNMDIQADDRYYGQISQAEQAGYIVAFPNGYSRFGGKLATWNAGHCCGGARDTQSDDVGFVREVVARLKRQLNIDAQRIFASGISNGAMMSYRLACEMPDTFRAIAAVAGTDNTTVCTPSRPVSILHIHARDDELVLFNGGAGRESDKVTAFVSVPDSIAKWVKLDACQPAPQRVLSTAGAYCEAYTGCQGGTQVQLCVTESGGHSWPGGQKPRGGTQPSSAIKATELIWDFFAQQ